MAVTEILAMLAVMVSADPTGANRTLSQHLGVAATVVRPPEVIAVSSADGRAVAIVRNSQPVEVIAFGGPVTPVGEATATVSSDGADRLVLTLVY